MFSYRYLISFLLLSLSIGFMMSCKQASTPTNQNRNHLLTIDFTKEYDSVETRLEELAKDIEGIHMETTHESLFEYFHAVFSEN